MENIQPLELGMSKAAKDYIELINHMKSLWGEYAHTTRNTNF